MYTGNSECKEAAPSLVSLNYGEKSSAKKAHSPDNATSVNAACLSFLFIWAEGVAEITQVGVHGEALVTKVCGGGQELIPASLTCTFGIVHVWVTRHSESSSCCAVIHESTKDRFY